ncbi:MAG: DUF5060 domain-containing protein [Verrucomicrobiota bacterium]
MKSCIDGSRGWVCAAASIVVSSALAAAAPAADFAVAAVPSNADLRLEYDADTNSYYRIQAADSLTGTWSVLDFQLGASDFMSWMQPGVISTTECRFYRIGRVPLTNSLDYDADHLGDAYELSHPSFDLRDRDMDSDGLLDGDEVLAFDTSAFSPYSGASVQYTFATNDQGWGADTGAYGTAFVTWSTEGKPAGGPLAVLPAVGSGYGDYYIKDGDLLNNQDVVARPIYRAWFFIPADAPSGAVRVQPWVKSTADGWLAHYDTNFHTLQPGQWTLVSWDMLPTVSTQVLADVDEWAVKIVWDNRTTWDGTVLLDTVHTMPYLPATNLPPLITSVSPSSGTVPRYEKFELTVGLTNVYGLNPYDPADVDVEATFTSPSGAVRRVWGFYMEDESESYGHGGWRVRFAPNEVGTWSYQVRVSNRYGTNTASSSTFECTAGSHHGPIRVSADDSHYLEHQDGTPFYGIGYCRPYAADDEGLFADAREHGVNLLHWWMAPWDTLLTVKATVPGRENSTFYSYEQGRAREIDQVVRHAETYGVKLVFTIWTHDALRDFNYHAWRKNGSWQKAFDWKNNEPEEYINAFSLLDDPSMNQKFFHDAKYLRYQDQLYRYIIARWGYSEGIGLWNLASELYGTYANSLKCVRWQDPLYVTNKNALTGLDPYQNMDTNQVDGCDYTLSWITYIHDFFKTNDPYGHPTTACNETDEYWDDGFAIVDVPQIHAYSESYSWVTPPIMIHKYQRHMGEGFNKPAFLGETGSWKWQTYQPDFLRACIWPALCSGAAVTPMMWTVPPFGRYCDPVMGPWLDDMADEAFLFSRFIQGIDFPRLHLMEADVRAVDTSEPSPNLLESFESGVNTNWHMFGTGITSIAWSSAYSTHGTNSLRMNIDMGPWSVTTNPASGVEITTLDLDWAAYWPDGTLRVDLYIPEFYHPTNNPDGFLKGINRDPRAVVEIAAERESDHQWNWYSTRAEYAAEHNGWKKLTVGMLYNLELRLEEIKTLYEVQKIRAIKIWLGDAGILRGPVYLDNISVGRYNYNSWGMMSSNREFAIAWIQDRQWTNTLNRSATFRMNNLKPGKYNVEWWNSRRDDINSAQNFDAATGSLYAADVPDFAKDIAIKIRRIGATNVTVHDVAVGCVSQRDWIVRSANARVNVTVVNQGTYNENVNLYLYDATATQQVSTAGVSVNAGQSRGAQFTWDCSSASLGWHTLVVTAANVSGEADLSDNRLTTEVKVVAYTPPWDPCERTRRWAPRSDITDARSLVVSTNRATEGGTSFLLTYAAPTGYEAHAEMWFDNVFENWAGKTSVRADVYRENGGASNVQFQIWTGTNWAWYYSWTKALTPGWNSNVTFTLNSTEWGNTNGWGVTPGNLDRVQQILFKFSDYTNAGSAYLDNIRLQ